MKAALYKQSWAQAKLKPPAQAAEKLSNIKIKDYSLIGFRDHEAENQTRPHLEILNSKIGFKLPKLYTLVSQNRKISIKENLRNPGCFFLNFESFKWSELFFTFFRKIVEPTTEQYVFKHLIYCLDIYVCQFQLLAQAAKVSSQDIVSALQRRKSQFELMSMIQNNPHSEKLVLLFVFELILISLEKPHFTACGEYITKAESQILLNYFGGEGLISLDSGKIGYSADKGFQSLRKYFEFRGQILFTENSKNIFCEKKSQQLKFVFEEIESVLEHKTFETCFFHT